MIFQRILPDSAPWPLYPKVTRPRWQAVRHVPSVDFQFVHRCLWKLSPKIHQEKMYFKRNGSLFRCFNHCKGTVSPDKNCVSSSALAVKGRVPTWETIPPQGSWCAECVYWMLLFSKFCWVINRWQQSVVRRYWAWGVKGCGEGFTILFSMGSSFLPNTKQGWPWLLCSEKENAFFKGLQHTVTLRCDVTVTSHQTLITLLRRNATPSQQANFFLWAQISCWGRKGHGLFSHACSLTVLKA